jgi:hypothetical protein
MPRPGLPAWASFLIPNPEESDVLSTVLHAARAALPSLPAVSFLPAVAPVAGPLAVLLPVLCYLVTQREIELNVNVR